MSNAGWIGVDLDGTLAEYDGWKGETHIGLPVPRMLRRVLRWLSKGIEVRIMTARACRPAGTPEGDAVRHAINAWCFEHIGQYLPITHQKDYSMLELWDDRAISVEGNTGRKIVGKSRA